MAPPVTLPSTRQIDLQTQHLQSLAAIHAFNLNGRIAVQMEKQGFSAIMHWQHGDNHDVAEVFSPFGSKLAVINRIDKMVTLITADQKKLQASTVEELTEQALGFKMPLTGLSDWALGRPSSQGDAPTQAQYDDLGRITKLSQQGWDIEYGDYQLVNNMYPANITLPNITLPGKMFLKSPKLNLKVLVESWQLNSVNQPNR